MPPIITEQELRRYVGNQIKFGDYLGELRSSGSAFSTEFFIAVYSMDELSQFIPLKNEDEIEIGTNSHFLPYKVSLN